MGDLKAGDIVRFDRSRGVITKVETRVSDHGRTVRTYAVVFWFGSRASRAVNTDWLTKVEVGGE